MDEKLSVRLAKEQDFQGVLEASEGVFDGSDYLPFVFHQWLKTPGKYTFVGELHGKIIAFQAANVIDGGQTIFSRSLRIHQDYRGRGYSYQMNSQVLNQVRLVHPGASKERFMAFESNEKMKRYSQRLGHEVLMKKQINTFQIPKQMVVEFRGVYNVRKELHELKVEDAAEFVLKQRKYDHIIPCKVMVVLKEPYELMLANADLLFKQGDKMFTDVSTDLLRQGLTPRSLSHGRLVNRVKQQSWVCNIYASERDVFKAHMIRHVMAAIEQLEKTGRKTSLDVQSFPDLDFEREVFREVLGLQAEDTDCGVCYESEIN